MVPPSVPTTRTRQYLLGVYLSMIPITVYVHHAHPITGRAPDSALEMPMPVLLTLGMMAFLGMGPGVYTGAGIGEPTTLEYKRR